MTDPVSPPTPAVVELKPCPFCEHPGPHEREHCVGTIAKPAYRIVCGYCGAGAAYSDRGDEAVIWNTRAAPTPVEGRGEPVAWLETNKLTGEIRVVLKRRADSPTMMRRWITEPLVRPAPVPVEPRPSAGADGEREALISDIEREMQGRQRGYADVRGELLFRCLDALRSNPPAETAEAVALETDEGGCVTKRFVIFTTPGRIPEKKGGWLKDDHLIDFLRDVMLHDRWPAGFRATVLELTWDNDLWASSASEYLAMHDHAMGPRRARQAWKSAREKHERIYRTVPSMKLGHEIANYQKLTALAQPAQQPVVGEDEVERLADELVMETAPDQGAQVSHAFSLALRLKAALRKQPGEASSDRSPTDAVDGGAAILRAATPNPGEGAGG